MPTIRDVKTSSEIEHVDWSTGGGSGQHNYTSVRYGSGSSQASQSSGDICRICHCESDPQNPLLTPCYCAGSLKYVHQTCLQQWLTASETNACELCKFPFIMHTKIKPFNEWRSLDITGIERRRLCCSLLFHLAAALCVIWSLCVLIERAADDVQRGLIDWPFWTKLAVVTVGMTGGIVFMYIQCKAYLHLCHRWKARNRILLIQNAPEKIHPLSPPSPVVQHRSRRCGSAGDIRNSQRASITVGTVADIGDNLMGTSMNNYGGYARTSAGIDIMGTDIDESGRAAGGSMHHRHHSLRLPNQTGTSGQSHMLPHADLDVDSLATQASSSSAIGLHANMLHHQNHQHQLLDDVAGGGQPPPLSQVAVAANIECSQSQHNYERDWALDDVVSQISSFRPCPQGSGSMIPFHDSIHNVLEHSEDCSSRDLSTGGASSDMGRDHAMQLSSFSGSGEHKAPSIGSGASNAVANGLGGFVYKPHNKRYSNSSIFLENRDILSDNEGVGGLSFEMAANDYAKCGGGVGVGGGSYNRQSTIILSNSAGGSDNTDNDHLDGFLDQQKRRFSDPKSPTDVVDAALVGRDDAEAHVPMLPRNSDVVLDLELPKSQFSLLDGSNAVRQSSTATLQQMHRSLHTVDIGDELSKQTQPCTVENSRAVFKSLPNLNSSCESLIKK